MYVQQSFQKKYLWLIICSMVLSLANSALAETCKYSTNNPYNLSRRQIYKLIPSTNNCAVLGDLNVLWNNGCVLINPPGICGKYVIKQMTYKKWVMDRCMAFGAKVMIIYDNNNI